MLGKDWIKNMTEIPLSISQIIFAIGITSVGAALQGGLGFGLGLLAVPLLININPLFVPGPLILAAVLLTFLVIIREHQSIQFLDLKWTMLGRFLGTFMGAGILLFFPQNYLSIIFGLMVLIAVTLNLSGLPLPLNRKNQFGAGTLSGMMSTVAAIGGPPLALIYQNLSGSRLRGTVSGVLLFGTILSVATLILIGKFGITELKLAFVLFPGILLGFVLSNYFRKVLDKGLIRPAVLTISAISAIIVILKNAI
jgi:uncharacterized membrane protein YfcA